MSRPGTEPPVGSPGSPDGDDPVRPPRLAEALLARFLAASERDEVLGDMAETLARRASRGRGPLGSRLWYWRQVLAIPLRLAWQRRRRALPESGEIRHAARGLARSPAFTAVAVLSLGLGIGANTAIFSTVRSLLFTPLPVDRPEELALVYHTRPRESRGNNYSSSQTADPDSGMTVHSNISYPTYTRLRQVAGDSIELLGFIFVPQAAVAVQGLPAVAAGGVMASGDYFSTLRLGTVLGRPLTPDDDRPEAPLVAVISHAFWQRAFGGDAAILDRPATLNGTPVQIVGVTPPGFVGLSPGGFFPPTDITVPLSAQPLVTPGWTPEGGSLFTAGDRHWIRMVARIPDDVARQPVVDALGEALRRSMVGAGTIDAPDAGEVRIRLLPGARGLDSLRSGTERPLRILAAVVALVLLIACANLASLSLARGAAGAHELAVRRALGASRLRLVRQLLLESSLLALAGGALGLLLALWSGPLITAALTAGLGPVAVGFSIDWALVGITAAVSLVAALASGLLPALRLTRSRDGARLAGRSRGVGGGERLGIGRALIAVQIAVSIPLIVGAGLFLRTLANLGDVDPGFDPAGLVVFRVDPSLDRRPPEAVAGTYRRVMENLEALPEVTSATLVENVLVSGWTSNTGVTIGGEEAQMYMNAVGPRFFETLDIPMVAGRPIDVGDGRRRPRVVVLNRTAAERWFGDNAVGRRFRVGDEEVEVVGVAADTAYQSLRASVEPTFYDSYLQRGRSPRAMHVVLRTPVPAARLEGSIREAVSRADPGLPVTGLRTQAGQIQAAVARERIFAGLLGVFGAFALLVACIGLHGVTSYSVARRTGEIGVRLALGAREGQIVWMVLRRVLVLALSGMALGLAAAWMLGPVVASMLYGLEPTDGPTLATAAAVMLAVALVAGWLPARRAAGTDAQVALTQE